MVVIAATNENFREAVRDGRFGSSPFYRQHAVVEFPRLCAGKGDILPLANSFSGQLGMHAADALSRDIDKEALHLWTIHSLGTRGGLRPCIIRAVIPSENGLVGVEELLSSEETRKCGALDFDEQERHVNRQ